ncbi:formyl transferase [Dehalococcoidia bacterium]|nr:formyl transferase [Dehalococcoidia bacterium]
MNILMLGPTGRNQGIINFLSAQGNKVLTTMDEISLDFLKEKQVKFLISSGYAPIIKKPIISAYPGKIINLHISYLPYGKGIYPNFWSFLEGTPNGVSIHFIDEGIDTGAILFQKRVSFGCNETLQSSHSRLMAELESLFFEKWDDIASGNYQIIRQEESDGAARCHYRLETERLIDLLPLRWSAPTTVVAEMGAELSLGRHFWDQYEQDVHETQSSTQLSGVNSAGSMAHEQ